MTDSSINQASNGSGSDKQKEATTKPSTNIEDLKAKFLKGFFQCSNEDELRDIFNLTKDNRDNIVPQSIKDNLIKFKSYPENNKDFQEIDIQELSKYDMIRELMIYWWEKLESSRKHLAELFNKLYVIKWDSKKNSILKEIEKLNQSDIEKCIRSETKRDEIISKIYNKSKPEKKDVVKALKSIEWLDYETLSPELKSSLDWFVKTWYETKELVELFKKNFTQEQKIALIKNYLWPTSLFRLKELWIVDKNQIESIINTKAREILKKFLTEDEINKKLSDFNNYVIPKNIILTPEEIFAIPWNQGAAVVDKLFEEDVLANFFKEARKQAKQEETKEAAMTEEEFRDNLRHKQRYIEGLEKMQKWDVIQCIIKNKDSDNVLPSYIYIKIEEIKEDWVIIKDIWHTSWWDKICENIDILPTSEYSFSNMIYFFEKVDGWKIYSKADFEEKKKSNVIAQLPNENVEIKTIESLKKLIDNEDSKWINHKLEVWTVFEFTSQQKDNNGNPVKNGIVSIASITKIGKDSITIRSQWETTFSFNDFYHAFKNQESTRVANIPKKEGVLKALQWNSKVKWFGDLEWDKDIKKIIYTPQKDNKDFPNVDHFINKKWDCLKIVKSDDGWFDVLMWEFTEKQIDDPKDKKKKKKLRDFTAKSKARMTPEIFYAYITKNWLNPYVDKDAIIAQESINKKWMEQKTSYSQAFFKLHNFASLLAGWKQFVDHIKNTLKATNDLQAAEFALTLGKILPKWMQSEFQAKVDWVNRGKMNDKIKELENLGPAKAMDYIVKRLKIKNLPRYELEWLLIYVVKRNWCLYPTWLSKNAWSYFWFKKLAWIPQETDITKTEIYRKYANARTRDWLAIVEEDMIETMISDLARDNIFRSSFSWEFVWEYKKWMNDSKEWWVKECREKYTTIDWKIDFTINWRLKAWRIFNAIWAVEWILEKWWTAYQMNYAPFVFLASWVLRTLDGKWAGDHLKSLWIKHREPMLLFCANPAKMDIFDKIFMDFANEEWGDLAKEAKSIMDARKSWVLQEDIVQKCIDFWAKNWDKLVTKFNATDPEMMIRAKEKEWEYKEYISHINWFLADTQCTKDHKDNDLCDKDRINFMSSWALFLSNNLKMSWSSRSFRDATQEKVFDSLIEWLDDIKKIEGNKEKQKKIYRYYNIEIIKWLAKNNQALLPHEKLERTAWWSKLTNRLWLPSEDMSDLVIHNLSWLDSWEFNTLIDTSFNKFIWTNITDKKNDIEDKRRGVKLSVNDILNKKPEEKPKINISGERKKLEKNIGVAEVLLTSNRGLENESEIEESIKKAKENLKSNNIQWLVGSNFELDKIIEEMSELIRDDDE